MIYHLFPSANYVLKVIVLSKDKVISLQLFMYFIFAPNEIVKVTNTVTKTYHKCYCMMEWGHRNRFLIIQQFLGINHRKSHSVAVPLDKKKITFNY